MAAYVIVQVEVTDPDKFKEYLEGDPAYDRALWRKNT